jgi:hypothetical protein
METEARGHVENMRMAANSQEYGPVRCGFGLAKHPAQRQAFRQWFMKQHSKKPQV